MVLYIFSFLANTYQHENSFLIHLFLEAATTHPKCSHHSSCHDIKTLVLVLCNITMYHGYLYSSRCGAFKLVSCLGLSSGGGVGPPGTGSVLLSSISSKPSTPVFQMLCSTLPSNYDSSRSFSFYLLLMLVFPRVASCSMI